jgi:hypothetical protein
MNEPVCGGHQDQVLLAKFAELSVHAEHSESMPPSRRVQLQWHGSLQLSECDQLQGDAGCTSVLHGGTVMRCGCSPDPLPSWLHLCK